MITAEQAAPRNITTAESETQAVPAAVSRLPEATTPAAGEIVVVFATNSQYAMPLGVALSSMLRNSAPGSRFDVTILESSLTPIQVEKLERVAHGAGRSVTLRCVAARDTRFANLPTPDHVTSETYLRYLLPEILPRHVDKALYLDCDLYVRADISRLWNTDLHGHSIMAAADATIQQFSHEGYGVANFRELGLSGSHPYFNAGVLLINLKKWRDENIGQKLIDYTMRHQSILRLADQEVMNAVFAHDAGFLDYSWNTVIRSLQAADTLPDTRLTSELKARRAELLARPAICHFAGELKPWNFGQYPPQSGTWIAGLLRSGWLSPLEAARWLGAWTVGQSYAQLRRSARALLRRKSAAG